jgi:hypothetical protein
MKRLARPAIAFGLAVGISMLSLGAAAFATPFSDVPANHWAYQYIQALAADGIIDGLSNGTYNGNRPMTRYEASALVARAVNKVRETGASKEDLDKLAKLVDAFRDELDALGVRVSNLEDRLDYLDQKTKFAQSISASADIRPQISARQITQPAANVNYSAAGDALVQDYLSSPDSNDPLASSGSGIRIRQDSKITFIYRVTDQLTVTFPIRLMNYDYGGTYGTQQSSLDIQPTVIVGVAKAGALQNFQMTMGVIDNLTSSRTGLAFKAPTGDFTVAYEDSPVQPLQKGVMLSGSINGTTDFNASFTRVDQVYFNTLGYDPSNNQNFGGYGYLYPVVPNQYGFTQANPAGTPRTDTFNTGSSILSQVYLTQTASNGSVYISTINGQPYNSNGTCATVPCNGPATAYAFVFNAATNAVVFTTPVPAGTVIGISYTATASTSNTVPQRYMFNGRVNQKFKSFLGGAEVGVTYTRIFDFDDVGFTTGSYQQAYQQAPTSGQPLLSDSVIGADFQVKLPFQVSGAGSEPTLFGELAQSKFTPDLHNLAATSDTAGVFGIKVSKDKLNASLQYQTIGKNYVVGDDIQFLGNPPTVLAGYRGPNLPGFFGFANNLAINQQFDQQFVGVKGAPEPIANNPTYTLAYPAYNPFTGYGTESFSAYNPNQAGITFNLNAPLIIGGANGTTFTTRVQYQHLSEITPNSIPAELYGPAYASNVKMTYDTVTAGAGFDLPVFSTKASFNLAGTYESLNRNDKTGYQYYPFNYNAESPVGAAAYGPTGAVLPPTSVYGVAAANAAIPVGCATCAFAKGSQVIFYPNYVNMKHYIFTLGASLPLTKDVVLNASYNTQPFGGSYGTTLGQNISEVKTYSQANLTYKIPKTNSSIQFQARNFHYTDAVVSSYNYNQNREDLNFSVRF